MKEKLKKFWDKISDGVIRTVVILLMFGVPIAGVIWGEADDKTKTAQKKSDDYYDGYFNGYSEGYDEGYDEGIVERYNEEYGDPGCPDIGEYDDPGCPIVPEFGPGSVAYEEAKCWPGVDPYRDVYVSKSSLTVHDSKNCCGMKYYYIMQAYEAYYYGYRRCNVCW